MAAPAPAPRRGSKSSTSTSARARSSSARVPKESTQEGLGEARSTTQSPDSSEAAATAVVKSTSLMSETPSAPSASLSQAVAAPRRSWSRRARWVASILIAGHVAAVFLAPFTFASTPAPGVSDGSPAAMAAMRWFHPYIEAMFLQHGYAFFAPDPGPSHLFRVKLEYADGRPSEEVRFPDLRRQQPRLLYHRHFMLSERLWVGHVPSVAPPGLSENIEELMQWRRSRESYETYYHTLRDSYLQHLIHQRGAATGVLGRVEHRLAGVEEIRERRRRLDAPESYAIHPDDARLFAEVLP